MHFHKIVHNMLDDLRIKVQQQEKIWSNLLEDSRIPILFQYALAYANYLNGVTSRGGMYGFEFDGLEKIVDCRSTKNTKRNLFIFLLEQIKQTKENAIFNEDFLILEYELLSKIPINQLELDLVDIKKGVKCIESAINTYTEEPRDRIKEVLSENYQRLLGETSLFEMQIKNLLELYQKNVRYLCENPKESSDKTAKKLLFMWQNCWSWKKEEERKQRDEIRKKAIAEKKNKTLGLPVELKTPIKRAADNLLKESNLSKVNSKANPEEIIKELHDKRKTKSFFFF